MATYFLTSDIKLNEVYADALPFAKGSGMEGLGDRPRLLGEQRGLPPAPRREWIRVARSIRTDKMSIDDVLALLRSVRRWLRAWTREGGASDENRHAAPVAVDNEYHVQDLLWAVLAPLFSDLESEPYSKKFRDSFNTVST